jgi:hypothetical protein
MRRDQSKRRAPAVAFAICLLGLVTPLPGQDDTQRLLQRAAAHDAGAALALCREPGSSAGDLMERVRRWIPSEPSIIQSCRKTLAIAENPAAIIDMALDAYWGSANAKLAAIDDLATVRNGETTRVLLALLDDENPPPSPDDDYVYESSAVLVLFKLPRCFPKPRSLNQGWSRSIRI